jgi:hypothetical protein
MPPDIYEMLVARLDRIEDAINDRLSSAESRLGELERWQSRMFGIGAVLVVFITIFGPTVRRLFNLE